jgi:hypothetical protein
VLRINDALVVPLPNVLQVLKERDKRNSAEIGPYVTYRAKEPSK